MSEHIKGSSHEFATTPPEFAWNGFKLKDEPGEAASKLPAGPAVLIMLVISASLWALIILAGLRALRFM